MTNKSKNDLRPLVIIGAGGHALSVANVAISAGFEISYFVDENKFENKLFGIKIIKNLSHLKNIFDYNYSIAIGDNCARESIYNELTVKNKLDFPILIHSSATISVFSSIEEGTVIMPKVVVGPNSKSGKFCLLNTQSSIDHDCTMKNFSSLAPGVVTGGSVEIGHRSAINIGAVIKHCTEIGDDSILGANSYLNNNLGSGKVAYGTPAKVVRERKNGDPYL